MQALRSTLTESDSLFYHLPSCKTLDESLNFSHLFHCRNEDNDGMHMIAFGEEKVS